MVYTFLSLAAMIKRRYDYAECIASASISSVVYASRSPWLFEDIGIELMFIACMCGSLLRTIVSSLALH